MATVGLAAQPSTSVPETDLFLILSFVDVFSTDFDSGPKEGFGQLRHRKTHQVTHFLSN